MTTTAEARTSVSPAINRAATPAGSGVLDGESKRGRRRHASALGLLVCAQFVVMLDTSIVNVALPSIQADLGLSAAGLTWVVNAYVLSFGGLLLLSGRAADLFGRRRMFTAGSALFTVGTLLAAAAPSEQILVAGRIIQGAGAAALSPAAMSLLMLTFTGPARAKAMSAWGPRRRWAERPACSSAASSPAPSDGRHFPGDGPSLHRIRHPGPPAARRDPIEHPAPVRCPRRGDHHRRRHRPCPWRLGAADGRWTSTSVLASFAASAALTGVFIRLERRAAEPLVPLELFTSRILSTGVVLAVLGGAARASSFVLVALYLQQALHMAPRHAGLSMVPTSLTGSWSPSHCSRTCFGCSASPHPGRRARHPRRRAPVVGLRPSRVRLPPRRAARPGPGRDRSRTQLHPHHHGHRLLRPRDAHGPGFGARRFGDPGRRRVGTATFTAIGIAVSGSSAGALDAPGFTAAFTAAAAVSVATAALGCSIAEGRR